MQFVVRAYSSNRSLLQHRGGEHYVANVPANSTTAQCHVNFRHHPDGSGNKTLVIELSPSPKLKSKGHTENQSANALATATDLNHGLPTVSK
jgi:hypothetical protein